MEEEVRLNDIAEDLLILNKHTIDTLFSLDNCADCVALYIFFYKTAKWQKTNSIKANEDYIKKSLGWGYDKIRKAKNTLKENGLIQIIQNRKDDKIEGWYIQVSYLVSQNSTDKIKVINNTQKQQVGNPTSRNQEANALKYNNICLNNIDNMLENNNKNNIYEEKENIKEKKEEELETINKIFDFWNSLNIIKHSKLNETRIKAIKNRLKEYPEEIIMIAMRHYEIVLHDSNSFWNYTWSLEDFLNRKNGFTTFLDDGSNWVSYESKSKNPYSSGDISRETAYPDLKKNYL